MRSHHPISLELKHTALSQIDQILPVSLESLIISRLDTDAVGARCQTPQPSFGLLNYFTSLNRSFFSEQMDDLEGRTLR